MKPYVKIGDLKDKETALEQLNFSLNYLTIHDFVFTLRNKAIAEGFADIAFKSGLSRESLYKILNPNSRPSLVTIVKVLNALGYSLEITPVKKDNIKKIPVRPWSFAYQYPELAREWHPKNGKIAPIDVTPESRKKVWWQCNQSKNHEWCSYVISRTKGRQGCPYCQATNILKNLNTQKNDQ